MSFQGRKRGYLIWSKRGPKCKFSEIFLMLHENRAKMEDFTKNNIFAVMCRFLAMDF